MKKMILVSILINLANSIVMVAQTVTMQRMFDGIAGAEDGGFFVWFIGFCVILLLGQVVNGALNLIVEHNSYLMAEHQEKRLNGKVAGFAPVFFDSEENQNLLQRAQNFFLSGLLQNVIFYNEVKVKTVQKTNGHEIRMKAITLAGYLAAVLLLVKSVLDQSISAGVFAAVFASLHTMFGMTEEVVCRQMGVIAENKPNIDCYRKLMKLSEQQTDRSGKTNLPAQIRADGAGESKMESGIEMRQVSFAYPGSETNALDHIDICIGKGEKIAIVGENGAGKSTFAKVLMGLYQPDTGEVFHNGKNIAYLDATDIYKHVSAVMQDFRTYSMTVNENVAFSEHPSEEKMDLILDEVGMSAVVSRLQDGKDTVLSRCFGGTDLSGGQWQRLAIARGYYKDAELLILDEPASAIDPKFEAEIYELFRRMAEGKTAIIITHRLAMARDADRILLLENGRIAECGSHQELMESQGKYACMYELQKNTYFSPIYSGRYSSMI